MNHVICSTPSEASASPAPLPLKLIANQLGLATSALVAFVRDRGIVPAAHAAGGTRLFNALAMSGPVEAERGWFEERAARCAAAEATAARRRAMKGATATAPPSPTTTIERGSADEPRPGLAPARQKRDVPLGNTSSSTGRSATPNGQRPYSQVVAPASVAQRRPRQPEVIVLARRGRDLLRGATPANEEETAMPTRTRRPDDVDGAPVEPANDLTVLPSEQDREFARPTTRIT